MGWTGDIAVFAATAAFNRDIRLFMKKWLTDLRLDQRRNGTLPVTIPEIKTYQPTPFPVPIAIWGDAATMVPWAVYYASGDKAFLAQQYESMKKYTEAEIRAAARFSRGTAISLEQKSVPIWRLVRTRRKRRSVEKKRKVSGYGILCKQRRYYSKGC